MSKPSKNFLESSRKSYKISSSIPNHDDVIPHSTEEITATHSTLTISEHENFKTSCWTKVVNKQNIQKYFGIFLGILASSLIALYQVIVRSLPSSYDSFDVSIWRFLGVLLPSIPFLIFSTRNLNDEKKASFLTNNSKLRLGIFLIIAAILSGSAVLLDVTALHNISASDTSVIIAASPIAVTFLSHFFIREKMGLVSISSSIIVLLGITIVTKPSFLAKGTAQESSTHLIGVIAAVGCMLATSLEVITMRYLKQVNLALIGLVIGFLNTGMCISISFYLGVFLLPQNRIDFMKLAGLCIASSAGIFSMYFALKFEDATTVALLRSTTPIFVCLFEYLLLCVLPDLFSLIGGFLVVIGIVAMLGFKKWRNKLPAEHNFFGKTWFNYL